MDSFFNSLFSALLWRRKMSKFLSFVVRRICRYGHFIERNGKRAKMKRKTRLTKMRDTVEKLESAWFSAKHCMKCIQKCVDDFCLFVCLLFLLSIVLIVQLHLLRTQSMWISSSIVLKSRNGFQSKCEHTTFDDPLCIFLPLFMSHLVWFFSICCFSFILLSFFTNANHSCYFCIGINVSVLKLSIDLRDALVFCGNQLYHFAQVNSFYLDLLVTNTHFSCYGNGFSSLSLSVHLKQSK